MTELSIKQAVDYTGKSENTIRRLLKNYPLSTHMGNHPFRKIKGKYYIQKEFLKEHYNIAEEEPTRQLDLSLVNHLQEQNKELNARVKELTHVVAHQSQQLASKDEQIRLLTAPAQEYPLTSGDEPPRLSSTLLIIVGMIIALLIAAMVGVFG